MDAPKLDNLEFEGPRECDAVAAGVLTHGAPPPTRIPVVELVSWIVRLAAQDRDALPEVHVIRNSNEEVSPVANPVEKVDEEIAWRVMQFLQNVVEHHHVEFISGRNISTVERDVVDIHIFREVQDHLSGFSPLVPLVP